MSLYFAQCVTVSDGYKVLQTRSDINISVSLIHGYLNLNSHGICAKNSDMMWSRDALQKYEIIVHVRGRITIERTQNWN